MLIERLGYEFEEQFDNIVKQCRHLPIRMKLYEKRLHLPEKISR